MSHVASELAVCCGALYGGLLIGILLDLFRLLHLPARARWLHELLDVLFWAAAGALAALTLLYVNGGIPRFYVFLCLAGGAILYQSTLSALLRGLFKRPFKK